MSSGVNKNNNVNVVHNANLNSAPNSVLLSGDHVISDQLFSEQQNRAADNMPTRVTSTYLQSTILSVTTAAWDRLPHQPTNWLSFWR